MSQTAGAKGSTDNAEKWAGLELRHLLALEQVAAEGSFARAASRLGYTPSAISQQIAALERIVGTLLVKRRRGPHPVSLTPAGQMLVDHVRTITARLAAARADVESVHDTETITLRVGTYQSAGSRILPWTIQRFTQLWPGVRFELTELNSDEDLLDLVENGYLDLTFAVLPLGDGPFDWVELLHDPFVLLVQRDSPLARLKRPPTPKEIGSVDVIGYRQSRSVHEAEERLRSAGINLQIVFRSNDNATLQAFVSAGIGAALVPYLALDLKDEGTVPLPLTDRVPPRVLALAWHRERNQLPPAKAFVDVVLAVSSELSQDLADRINRRGDDLVHRSSTSDS